MAYELQTAPDLTYRASANVTTLVFTGNPPVYSSGGIAQFTVVTQDIATGLQNDIIAASSPTVMPLGVAQSAGPVVGSSASGPGNSVQVRTQGVSKVIAGAAITVGQLLMVDASGRVIPATAPAATNVFLVGQAESAAAALGDLVSVRLMIGATQQINA